ncbi:MAG TPA: homocysteine S-methyltransferase family protein, partial [Terriglobales bacterium]|nr:homocysteine S-methyltransferase family protein [Terriglobales bacterium]
MMTVREKLKAGLVYLDGGTGTLLQAMGLAPGELPELWNLKCPDRITSLHRAYYEAGSNIVYTNTFGANPLKYDGMEGRPHLAEVVRAAISNARAAANEGTDRYVALDIGPLGRMLAPLGDLPFEEAVALFAEIVRAGAQGADLVAIETMNDAYETKAALLAVKENCGLPVIVTNVYDEAGRLMTGATPEAMVAMLEGMGADAVGMNCSLGPAKMVELVPRFIAAASVPVIVKPNAGLPRAQGGSAVYDVGPEGFAASMQKAVRYGARVVGGCCGTTPEFITALAEATKDIPPAPLSDKRRPVVSSGRQAVALGGAPVMIGERINPTGKKRLGAALREGDLDALLREGLLQEERGAAVLDVNVGLPGLDEAALLES